MDRTLPSRPPCASWKLCHTSRAVLLALYTLFSLLTVAFAETSTTEPEPEYRPVSHIVSAAQQNNANISHSSFSQSQGLIRVNLTAGSDNLQNNSTALAVTQKISTSTSETTIPNSDAQIHLQGSITPPVLSSNLARTQSTASATTANSAAIKGDTFQNVRGFIAINQSAGANNQQYNALTISNGISSSIVIEADESILADTSSGNGLNDLNHNPTSQSLNSANIAPDTFAGARGVVQINQTAGTGNVSANLFTLSIGDSVKP
jgi:hypothetical protein